MLSYRYEPKNNRVAAYKDGMEVGQITFIPNGDIWDATHTFVDPVHRGGPIASEMLKLLVETAREEHKKIIPICSYVKKALNAIEEYQDVLKQSAN